MTMNSLGKMNIVLKRFALISYAIVLFVGGPSYSQKINLDYSDIHYSILDEFSKYLSNFYINNKQFYIIVEEISINDYCNSCLPINPTYYLKLTFSECFSDIIIHEGDFYHTINEDSVLVIIDSISQNNFTELNIPEILSARILSEDILDEYYFYSTEYKLHGEDKEGVETICQKNSVFEVFLLCCSEKKFQLYIVDSGGSKLLILDKLETLLNTHSYE